MFSRRNAEDIDKVAQKIQEVDEKLKWRQFQVMDNINKTDDDYFCGKFDSEEIIEIVKYQP